MPRAKKTASKTAKKGKDDLCILNCPPIKDHINHIIVHLGALLQTRNLSAKERKDAIGVQTMIRQVQDHMDQCLFQAHTADCLPERE